MYNVARRNQRETKEIRDVLSLGDSEGINLLKSTKPVGGLATRAKRLMAMRPLGRRLNNNE